MERDKAKWFSKKMTFESKNEQDAMSVSHRDVRRWLRERRRAHLPKPPKSGYAQFKATWWQPADFAQSPKQNGVWWLGHSTMLVRLNGQMILTDPIFSERASPVTFAGPKRKTPPACQIDDLPHVDVVVISHNHYDHLDAKSIRQLVKRFPRLIILVPLGLKQTLHRFGAKQVIEMDWWRQVTFDDVTFHCVPAKHWSQRTLWDKNRSLWCGWVMQSPENTAYFMGDTAYCSSLFEIGQRFEIDLAMMPIGAYAPRWFMQGQHIDPAQAVQLFKALNCQRAIAMHWGTFELSDESLDEPVEFLAKVCQQQGVSKADFTTVKIGTYLPI